jgi:hypothetical protein
MVEVLALEVDVVFKKHNIEFEPNNQIADVVDKMHNHERPTDNENCDGTGTSKKHLRNCRENSY